LAAEEFDETAGTWTTVAAQETHAEEKDGDVENVLVLSVSDVPVAACFCFRSSSSAVSAV